MSIDRVLRIELELAKVPESPEGKRVMFGRPILPKQEKLVIIVDSRSLHDLLANGNHTAKTILKYSTCELFEFVRSPLDTAYPELKGLPVFIQRYDDKGNLTSIDIVTDKLKSTTLFGYKMADIEEIGKHICKKRLLTSEEREAILLVFIHSALHIRNEMRVMTTNNKVLLSNRIWFESHFPGRLLNIATVEETKEVMDLFAKYRSKYYISGHYPTKKWEWYWYSFRSKIPNYHVGDSILDAFASRFVYLLMSLDEIGFQYYSGASNDTMETTIYHFNYFISLISGIFDALAIKTKNQLDIKFDRDSIDSRTSLNPKAGKEFLKQVREKSPDLRQHIMNNIHFIKLIYDLRELVVHREMLPKSGFEDSTKKWKANFITVNPDIADLITQCGDRSQDYEPMTIWGLYSVTPRFRFLEPYHFSKAAATALISLCNTFLHLLGFGDFLESFEKQGKKDIFTTTMERFREDSLGF